MNEGKSIFSEVWGEVQSVFGDITGSINIGGGEKTEAALSFGKHSDRFWLYVFGALVLGLLIGAWAGK